MVPICPFQRCISKRDLKIIKETVEENIVYSAVPHKGQFAATISVKLCGGGLAPIIVSHFIYGIPQLAMKDMRELKSNICLEH